jgi:hypothetical protein
MLHSLDLLARLRPYKMCHALQSWYIFAGGFVMTTFGRGDDLNAANTTALDFFVHDTLRGALY